MKTRDFRSNDKAEEFKKATKLSPIKKSGKERHNLFKEEDDDLDDLDYKPKHESILDYYDEEEEEN